MLYFLFSIIVYITLHKGFYVKFINVLKTTNQLYKHLGMAMSIILTLI